MAKRVPAPISRQEVIRTISIALDQLFAEEQLLCIVGEHRECTSDQEIYAMTTAADAAKQAALTSLVDLVEKLTKRQEADNKAHAKKPQESVIKSATVETPNSVN